MDESVRMPFDFWQFAGQYGLPFAMLAVALITNLRGDWLSKRTHDREIAILEANFKIRLQEKDEDNTFWRNIAMRSLQAAEEVSTTSRKLVERSVS